MPTEVVHLRLPREDVRWIEDLARRNGVRASALARVLIHGIHLAAEQGKLKELDLGVITLR